MRAPANGTITGKYNNYTMEVVQQIGSDSFDPGHGVLISKTKNTASSCGNFNCFVWVIDAHPEDINQVDYIGPDGTPKMATPGDERQKNDASFNAGLNSGSSYEYEDTANRLHFYIIDKRTDAAGHPALQGRRQVARRRRPADARRRLAAPAARQRRGLHDLHVQPDQHGRGGGDAERAPAGRVGVPEQRRLPALRHGDRHGLERVPQERAGHRQVRRVDLGAGLHREGHRLGHGHAQRGLRERSDARPRARSARWPTAPSAARCRPRWR